MRIPTSIAAVAFVLLGVVACSSSTGGTDTNGANGGAGAAGGASECASTCSYYLQCKGLDASYQTTCEQSCAQQQFTNAELSSYKQMDCPSAVAAIESHPTPGGGSTSGGSTSGGSTSGGAKSKDCDGCVWDGSSCIYLTGSGGNYFACSASCC